MNRLTRQCQFRELVTKCVVHNAERLASRDNDVLLIDLDQQGNATEGIGLNDFYKADTHLGHVLTDDGPDPHDVIEPAHNFDAIPAHQDFDDLEDKVRNSTFGMLWLRRKVVVPLLMSEPSVSGFERMVDQQIRPIQNEVELEILAIVPNGLSGNNEEKRIINDLEQSPFAEQLPMFARSEHFTMSGSSGPGIRDRIAFSRAWRDGVPSGFCVHLNRST